ncbi:hypothetical protein TTHERM_000538521 (macronuclear) [Tetrahymena thermophila SB210]|uniref:Uncharacterized protein n=1 Tax=Tetrahymena thermophila (strain SB210) TaxID=312017 RepID=W7XH19_TETTS|nr:hypothetical protein TTHERM_000538521 [Tetrahymena thermophila SB210]EWS76408.1 hypothetical protein TTHERM_000538521 [Tetrahymena thermophila SB210]|eukprot:XP_012651032.1 hypothetical protein TTHERM_000538521 [Tetrahymena thermophila SB210]
MKRKATLLNNNQIFVQFGQNYLVYGPSEYPEQKQLKLIQQYFDRKQFYENIYLKVEQVQSDYIISILSYNYYGINYMMTDIIGQSNCQYNTNVADYFQLQKRLQQYFNLRENTLLFYGFLMQHYVYLNMYENFKFLRFPVQNVFQYILRINGTNYVEGIINLNQLISSQTLSEISFYNLIIHLQEEEDQQQQQQIGSVQLQQLQFLSCEIIFNNKTLIAQNLLSFSFINVSITNQNIETSLIIQNTQNLIMVDNNFADNKINTKQFVTFNNTVDYYKDSEFIFRNNNLQITKLI